MTTAARASGSERPRPSRRPLTGLLLAMAVSLTGTRISAIAFPWFVLATTGSATKTGLVAFCELTPYVVVKALSGPWIDRVGGRLVSWSTDLVSAVAAAAIPLLHLVDALSLPVFLALVAVVGAARGPGDLAKEIMVPEAAERVGVPLVRATGLSGTVERLASTVGPAVGGAVIALIGPVTGVAVNAACFVLGALLVAVALPHGMGRPAHQADAQDDAALSELDESSYLRRLAEGFGFLIRDPLLVAIVVMVGITNLLDMAFAAVLLPVWAHDSGAGAAGMGLALTVMSAAAVVGSLLASALAHRMRRRPVFFVGFLVAGAPRFIVLLLDVPLPVVLGVFAVAGLGSGFLNPILGAVLFERVPQRLYGRVGALTDAIAWAGMPVGGLMAGVAVTAVGLSPVLLVCGVAYFLTTTLTALRPEWKEMDAPSDAERSDVREEGDHAEQRPGVVAESPRAGVRSPGDV
ncbi:MFS transporter [Mumia zhuanghuii]|uniref:Multidrug efflux pump Tap n=2 Tax=Mumia TaxID=1546255 RepID=A0ABW1QLV2_9ACTN|nr:MULTISPECIES: MFS transporter [Mumia]KAA1419902.1 MFS transporter [Mumia zhuanghuii]